jgi:hypothetical protein
VEIGEVAFPELDPLAIRLEFDEKIRALRETGISYEDIAESLDASIGTAHRACTLYAERPRARQNVDHFYGLTVM